MKIVSILTYVNSAVILLAVSGLGVGLANKQKIIDSALGQVTKELPNLIKKSVSMPKIPKATGPALPLNL